MPSRIVLRTPAKINLLLHVTGKRNDGYHDIITVMQMLDLWDELIIEQAEKIDLVCTNPEVPSDQENLICRAAVTLKEYSGIENGAAITLNKIIPVAAGLGGGSSDAAATLFALNIIWGLDYTVDRLMDIGSRLGSDVPFFLNGPTALGYGRGDELIALQNPAEDYWFLLANPGIHVSTAWAYGQLSLCHSKLVSESHDTANSPKWIGPFSSTKFELTNSDGNIKIFLPDGLRIEEDKIWLLPLNDLEEVVIKRYPIIGEIKEKMFVCGAMCSLMSGSGSTVFGIFKDKISAERAYISLKGCGWRMWIVKALEKTPYSY